VYVCVYCSSSEKIDQKYRDLARDAGTELARRGHTLVSGGAKVSCMGEIARAVRAAGGRTIGVIPRALVDVEIADTDADELIVTADMRERKGVMDARSDAFLVLPGGIGTLEELVEQLTWSQLGRHRKPILMLDTRGFWRPLLSLFAHMNFAGFIRPGLNVTYLVAEKASDIIPMLNTAAQRGALAEPEPEAAAIGERF
jgi:uncharacterized protein (TIGR00730 family)